MPFIDSKITGNVSKEKREAIKSKLGQAVSILHKSETFLMVGFEDQYDLYMAEIAWNRGLMCLSACSGMHLRRITRR